MSEKEVLVSKDGFKKLGEELDYLKSIKRSEVAARIKTGIEFGDLSENSEYDDAKNEQAFIEGRISTLDRQVRNARIIEHQNGSENDQIEFGSVVTILDLEYTELLTYTIVGSPEASPQDKKISNESPVGKALMGRRKGETIEVEVPSGRLKFEIVGIE
ncbi:MAG: transcription elongation factor GreA [bacterium]|nr:transcription elongation factor GreA [bacterium]